VKELTRYWNARRDYYFVPGSGGQWRRLIGMVPSRVRFACDRMRISEMSPGRSISVEFRAADFRKKLLAWYDTNARDLPWRKSRDPYRVWVSEIMLQQTRVAAVIEHYHEFLRRFPTVQKLAAARKASVLAAWSGLGYYRRARMLHAAARVISRERGGKFPKTADTWRDLPGIGRYTAAAIASIALGEAVAVVDGNVERVIQRLGGERISRENVWRRAGALLYRDRAGDFNQAMMELGATVCTPRAPVCLTCPVMELCKTRGELAASKKASKQRKGEIHYALDCRNGAVFLTQRGSDESLMAGMWELPEIAGGTRDAEPVMTLRHSITTTDYTVHVWAVPASTKVAGEWYSAHRLPRTAITGLARKILQKARWLTATPAQS